MLKAIDGYQIGDMVRLQMTGMIVKFGAKCISTKQKPTDGTPEHDHPRFEIVKVADKELNNYLGMILKPGDYIIMGSEKVKLNETEIALLLEFLAEYDNRLSNDGCNDMILTDTPEHRALLEAAERWNCDNPEDWREITPCLATGKLITMNSLVLGYLVSKLEKVLKLSLEVGNLALGEES